MGRTLHVVLVKRKWCVKWGGNQRAFKRCNSKKEAIKQARMILGGSDELVIHGMGGRIERSRDSMESSPFNEVDKRATTNA